LRLPPERRLDLLAVLADERPMQALLEQLREAGFGVDVARDLAAARQVFFGAGGHDCVLVGPDVAPGIAGAVVDSLRTVDPELPAVTFGPALAREHRGQLFDTLDDALPASDLPLQRQCLPEQARGPVEFACCAGNDTDIAAPRISRRTTGRHFIIGQSFNQLPNYPITQLPDLTLHAVGLKYNTIPAPADARRKPT